ncbi:MAG: phospholipid carrier-dependent glycosyltransferase [Deltaproteobacteria bacterium]|nr:phospholipid carrier-dependent glycosyltransferase [Deltaproteobacteria bacterium]
MKRAVVSILFIYALIYLLPLGARPLFIPDETRYAEIPREMIATGDYTVPRLNGLHYFEKPVLGYWLNAISIKAFGENAFAVRLPSALATGISAVFVFFAACLTAGAAEAGLFAACIFLTFFAVFGIGEFAVLDSMFSLFVTGAMAFFLFAYDSDPGSRKRGWMLALCGLFAGLAFLAKGFIAFAIPVVSIVPFLIWEKKAKEIFRIPWIPIATAILVSLPWVVAIGRAAPDFWHFFIVNEHIRRFVESNAQHAKPFWFFLVILPGAAMSWTFVFPAAFSGLKKEGTGKTIVRYLVCWLVFPFIFFSMSKGKLATYILPCFAPLAVLFAIGLETALKDGRNRLFSRGALALSIFVLILAAGLAAVQMAGPQHIRPYTTAAKWLFIEAGLISWAFLSFLSANTAPWRKKAALFCAAPLCFMFAAHFAIPDTVLFKKAPEILFERHTGVIGPDTLLVSETSLAPAISWFYKKSDVFLFQSRGELSYGLSYPDAAHRYIKDVSRLKALIAQRRNNGGVVLVLKKKKYAELAPDLPVPVFSDTRGNFVMAGF